MSEKARAPDRPAGILTPEQRRFIIDGPDEDLSPEVIRQRWYRIRRQVRNAFIDFVALLDIPEEQQQLIFKEYADADSTRQADPTEFYDGLMGVFYFVLKNTNQDIFSGMVREAIIVQMMNEYPPRGKHPYIDVNIDVTVETVLLEKLKERVENGGELSIGEFGSLNVAGRINEDEWEQYKSALNGSVEKK